MAKPIILSEAQIAHQLKDLAGWTASDDKLRKEFLFEDFMDSLNFVVELTPFFEENDHHPDIHILYDKIIFELQRFDLGGKITDKDFVVARKIQEEYDGRDSTKE